MLAPDRLDDGLVSSIGRRMKPTSMRPWRNDSTCPP
jgi:hypothetical protein